MQKKNIITYFLFYFTNVRFLLIFFLIIFIICVLVLNLTPPISRDALTHHLAIPKLYLQHGGLYEIPWLDFSYSPMNLDFLYTISLFFGNDIIPKYIHFGFGLGTALLVYRYLKNRINYLWGLFGALFFLSTPIITKLSITVYVDLGLVFFTTASLLFLFEWILNNFCTKYIILAAISCGLALGTKSNGLVSLLLLTCLVPYLYLNSTFTDKNNTLKSSALAFFYGILFIWISFIFFSPWAIRNWLWVNNPFFPLFQSFFSTEIISNSENARFMTLTVRNLIYGESTLQILLLPIRIFFEGQDNVAQYFDGKLNPALLLIPALGFLAKRADNKNETIEKLSMLLFSILFLSLGLLLTNARIRYIVPIVPFLIILSCYGLHNLVTIVHKKTWLSAEVKKTLTMTIILLVLFPNIIYLKEQFIFVQPFNYISGKTTKEEYITQYRPEYPAIKFINESLPQESRVLCFFMGNRGYYMNFDHRFTTPTDHHNTSFFEKNMNNNSASIWQPNYILIRNDLFNKWYNSLGQSNLSQIPTPSKLLFQKNGYSVLSLTF